MTRSETKNRIDFMILDTDFFEKPENVEAVDKFGDAAPAAILRLCLKLMNEKEATMKKSQVLAMWRASGTDQEVWAQIIDYYVACGWLIEQNDGISSARIEKERNRVKQKREQLSANAKQKLSKCKAGAQQNESKSTDTDTDIDLNKNKLSGKFCFLDDISAEQLQITNGGEVVARAVQIVDGWVEQSKDDLSEFTERKKKARHGVGPLKSWALSKAIQQIEQEKRAKPKPFEVKPPEPSRPQPPPYVPPDIPKVTEEQRIKNLAKLRELQKSLSKGVPA